MVVPWVAGLSDPTPKTAGYNVIDVSAGPTPRPLSFGGTWGNNCSIPLAAGFLGAQPLGHPSLGLVLLNNTPVFNRA